MLGAHNHKASELDTLSFIIGTGVVSLRSKNQARSVAVAHFNKSGRGAPLGDSLDWEDFDQVVVDFVRWLERPQGRLPDERQSLLQKLRLTPEYAGHFVLG